MVSLKSGGSVLATALYVALLASPAASQEKTSPDTTTSEVPQPSAKGAPGPEAGVGLASTLMAGAVVYLIGRHHETDRK